MTRGIPPDGDRALLQNVGDRVDAAVEGGAEGAGKIVDQRPAASAVAVGLRVAVENFLVWGRKEAPAIW